MNRFVKTNNYPLKRTDDLIQVLHSGGMHFSKIGLTQAYHQIKVDEETGKVLTYGQMV